MKRSNIILFIFLWLFFFQIGAFKANADGSSLKVSPTVFRIEAQSPADIRAPFTIENQSNQSVSLKLGYKIFDPQASQNGTVSFFNKSMAVPAQTQQIFDHMQIIDNHNLSYDSIELGPKQKKNLQLRIILPTGQSNADYYFSLIFLENLGQNDQNNSNGNIENQTSTVTLQSGIGLNVLLAVGTKTTPQGTINIFTTPFLRQSGPVPFDLKVTNTSSHYILPRGTILIKNLFGQKVGKIIIPPSIILAGTSRMISSKSHSISANNTPSQQFSQLDWPSTFLFGFYTADLSLALSDQGPIYTKSIHFIAFPLSFVLELLVLTFILLFIIIRVRHKISHR